MAALQVEWKACGGECGPGLRQGRRGRREDPKQPVQTHLALTDGGVNIISS